MALQVEPRGTKLNEGGRRMSALSVVVGGFVVGMFIYLCFRWASAAWYRSKLDVIKEMSRERTERGEHREGGTRGYR